MASRQPKDVNGFVGEREQTRAPLGKYPQRGPPGSSHGQPPRVPTHASQQQSLKILPNADLAVRRQNSQNNRQNIGNSLRLVGPPTIYNPDELPPRKRSAATLIEKAQKAIYKDPEEDIAALASQVASFNPFATKTPRATFDDTESIMTTDTDCVARDENYNQYSIALATDYNKRDPASNPNLKLVSSDHANQMRGEIILEEEDEESIAGEQARTRESSFVGLEPGWKETAETEKQRFFARYQRQSNEPTAGYDNYAGPTQYEQSGDAESDYYTNGFNDIDNHEYQDIRPDDWVDGADAGSRVPSRSKSMAGQTNRMSQAVIGGARAQEPLTKVHAGNTGFAEPAAEEVPVGNTGNQVWENTGSNAMAPPPKPAHATKKTDKGKQAVRNTNFTMSMRSATPPTTFPETKATSFGSSSPSPTSEQDLTLPNDAKAAAHKRNFENSLDYTREQLADLSYDELDTKPFLADPNKPPREPARNQNGVKLTLEQKLSRMTETTEDQCKAMFTSMTDAENEGTGRWFIAKMQEDMENLMIAKHKRRMIALKYEHEIKKRNSTVKAKMKDVEDELEGLKNGLGSLIPQTKKG